MMNNYKFLATVLGCFLIFGGIFFLLKTNEPKVPPKVEEMVPIKQPAIFPDVKISGRSAVVFDINSGNFIYEKNSTTSRPLASVTKLMTAYTAAEHLTATSVIIFQNESWKLSDVRDVMLVASSNEAAEAIANNSSSSESFLDLMNSEAVEKGWSSMSFKSPSGLDQNDIVPTAYGNARDVAFLLKTILQEHSDILEPTRDEFIKRSAINGIPYTYQNTNITLKDFSSVLGSKTGFTESAGGNLALVYNIGLNRPIVIVVLGSENQVTRFEDVKILASGAEEFLIQ